MTYQLLVILSGPADGHRDPVRRLPRDPEEFLPLLWR